MSVASTLTHLEWEGSPFGTHARCCRVLCDLDDAARAVERALVIKERDLCTDHRLVASTLTHLGDACGDLGDAARQRDLLERTLVFEERD